MANFSLNQDIYINMTVLQASQVRKHPSKKLVGGTKNTQFVILSTSVRGFEYLGGEIRVKILAWLFYIHAKTLVQSPYIDQSLM